MQAVAFAAPESFVGAFGRILANAPSDPSFAAEALMLPSEHFLAEQMSVVDPDAIHAVRTGLARKLGEVLRDELLAAYRKFTVEPPYSPDAASAGKRSLRNLCLAYLMEAQTREACDVVQAQFSNADNMTDAMAALAVLSDFDCAQRSAALETFYTRWQHEPLVIDKWLRVQALSRLPGTLAEVKRLTTHPAFSIKNPNKVYALIGAFTGQSRPLPCCRRQRLRVRGGADHRTRQAEPAGGGAHGTRIRSLQEIRRRPPAPCTCERSSAYATRRGFPRT